MSPEKGTEPVADEELLFRRVPGLWYQASDLSLEAFHPHKDRDKTGLSLVRAKYKTIEEASVGRSGKSYFVAVFRAGDLVRNGIHVAPAPLPGDPGHVELPQMNASNRHKRETVERKARLKELCLSIEGPFPSVDQSSI